MHGCKSSPLAEPKHNSWHNDMSTKHIAIISMEKYEHTCICILVQCKDEHLKLTTYSMLDLHLGSNQEPYASRHIKFINWIPSLLMNCRFFASDDAGF